MHIIYAFTIFVNNINTYQSAMCLASMTFCFHDFHEFLFAFYGRQVFKFFKISRRGIPSKFRLIKLCHIEDMTKRTWYDKVLCLNVCVCVCVCVFECKSVYVKEQVIEFFIAVKTCHLECIIQKFKSSKFHDF